MENGILPPGRYDAHMHVMAGKPEPGRFRDSLEAAGIAGGALYSENPDPVDLPPGKVPSPERAMDNLLAWIDGSKTIFPFYWINPIAPDALSLVDLAESKGMMGYKVLPGTFHPGDERAMEVYAKIASLGKPVMFHSGILWDGRFSSCHTRPGNYEALLSVPGLRFALAHLSWPWVDESLAVYGKLLNSYRLLGEKAPEAFLDITPGTPPIYRKEALTKLFTIGYDVKDHVLFGTDGMTPGYGMEWSRQWQARDDAIYSELGLSRECTDGIYRGAFERFLFGSGQSNLERELPGQIG